METTETRLDGSIESALNAILEPEQPEEIQEEVAEAEEVEDVAEEESDDSEDDYEPEQDEDESEDDAGQEALYTVKVDGQEVEVTLNDLKQGYSGQAYVQKGMQQAAEQKKQAEAVYAALMTERQQLSQLVEQMQSGQFVAPPIKPDPSLAQTDPVGYIQAEAAYNAQMQDFNQQAQQLQQVMQQQSQAQQQAFQAHLQQELEALKVAVPEFADPVKATETRDLLLRTGTEVYGLSQEEVAGVTDHRLVRILRDAARYHEIVNSKARADQKAKTAPKKRPVKAGAKQTDSRSKASRDQKSKLKRSGSIDDALSLILKQ